MLFMSLLLPIPKKLQMVAMLEANLNFLREYFLLHGRGIFSLDII
jgi:hypothetical protein